MATREELLIEVRAQNQASPALKQVQADVKGLGGAVGQANDVLGTLGISFSAAAVVAGMFEIGKASIQLAMDFEQTRIAFTNMLGSADAADAFIGELRDFAAQTPFEFKELTEAARRMKALGFETEQVIPLLTSIGDAVAAMGGNAAMVDRVTLALGQMLSKGKVQAGEMLQLTEAGIPGWKYLAEAIGVTTAEVQKMSEKGLIPAEQAIAAIQAGMSRDFGGMMAEQAETAAGKVSMLTDSLDQLGVTLGNVALPAFKAVVDQLIVAANTANLLATQTETLNTLYTEHEAEVRKASSSYEIYTEEMLRTGVITRQISEDDKERISTLIMLRENYIGLSEEQVIAAVASGELSDEQADLLFALQGNVGALDEEIARHGLLTKAMFDAQAAFDIEDDRLRRLSEAAALAAEKHDALIASQNTALSSTDLLSAGMDNYTTKLLFNKAAAGLDADAALALGIAMGVVDTKSLLAAQAVETLKVKYDTNRDGAIDAAEAAAGYSDAILGISEAIDQIPDKKDVTINVNTVYTQSGSPPSNATGGGIVPAGPPPGPIPQALDNISQSPSQLQMQNFVQQAFSNGQIPSHVYVIQDQLAAAMLLADRRNELARYADYLMA